MEPPNYKSLYVTVAVACIGGITVLYTLRLLGFGFVQGPLQPIFLVVLGATALSLAFGLVLTWMLRGMSRSMDEEGALLPGESPHELPEAGKANLSHRRQTRKDEIASEIRSVGRLAQQSVESGSGRTGTWGFKAAVLSNIVRLRGWRLQSRLLHRARIRNREVVEARSRLESSTLQYSVTGSHERSEEREPVQNASEYGEPLARVLATEPSRDENVKLILHGTHYAKNEETGRYFNRVHPVSEMAYLVGLSVAMRIAEPPHYYPIVEVSGDIEEVSWLLIKLRKRGLGGFKVEAEDENDRFFCQHILSVEVIEPAAYEY